MAASLPVRTPGQKPAAQLIQDCPQDSRPPFGETALVGGRQQGDEGYSQREVVLLCLQLQQLVFTAGVRLSRE